MLDLAIFSDQEALSLHFNFKLKFIINLLPSTGSLAILNASLMPAHLRTYPAIQSGNETTQKSDA